MFDESLKTWMVLAAHFDDEALMFGNLLLTLAAEGRMIWIAVLTAVAHTNPAVTPEQIAGEPQRQARRLAAFAHVCGHLNARPIYLGSPQLATVTDQMQAHIDAREALLDAIDLAKPDAIITHGRAGEYTASKYSNGWHTAREQHAFASRLCNALPGVAVYRREPDGPLVVPAHPRKAHLLAHYRVGTTQTPTWEPEEIYPEFVNEPERYAIVPRS